MTFLHRTPQPPQLLPDARCRARVRALAQSIACNIHPINNLRVLRYLSEELGVTAEQKGVWYRYWLALGLHALPLLDR